MIKNKVKLNKFHLKQMETTMLTLQQEKLGIHTMVLEVILRIIGNWDTKNKGKSRAHKRSAMIDIITARRQEVANVSFNAGRYSIILYQRGLT